MKHAAICLRFALLDASLGPRSDNRGYGPAAGPHADGRMRRRLQWVQGRITFDYGRRNRLNGFVV